MAFGPWHLFPRVHSLLNRSMNSWTILGTPVSNRSPTIFASTTTNCPFCRSIKSWGTTSICLNPISFSYLSDYTCHLSFEFISPYAAHSNNHIFDTRSLLSTGGMTKKSLSVRPICKNAVFTFITVSIYEYNAAIDRMVLTPSGGHMRQSIISSVLIRSSFSCSDILAFNFNDLSSLTLTL